MLRGFELPRIFPHFPQYPFFKKSLGKSISSTISQDPALYRQATETTIRNISVKLIINILHLLLMIKIES